MKIFNTMLICLSLFLLGSCANTAPNSELSDMEPLDPESIVYSGPVNPQATDDAAAVLKYLTDLSNESLAGVISGQNCFHGDQITSANVFDGYNTMMVALYEETGKFPGMIGLDYEYERIYTSEQLTAANEILIDYWNEGGLVMITWTPKNPWVLDGSDLVNNHGTWNGPGHVQDHTGVDLKELVDPTTAVYAAWYSRLDRIAVALAELRDAGVVVLFRPMQEMNGNWHWWGMKSHPYDASQYTEIYIDMYEYFTDEKGLNNLLWVYSPNIGAPMDASWNRPVEWAYPGDEYVDVVAGTCYSDTLVIEDYRRYLSFGKPLGMAEYSPESGGLYTGDGSMDTTLYATRLLNDYPAMSFWVSWHSFPGEAWSIVANQNTSELMNNPGVITRGSLGWNE